MNLAYVWSPSPFSCPPHVALTCPQPPALPRHLVALLHIPTLHTLAFTPPLGPQRLLGICTLLPHALPFMHAWTVSHRGPSTGSGPSYTDFCSSWHTCTTCTGCVVAGPSPTPSQALECWHLVPCTPLHTDPHFITHFPHPSVLPALLTPHSLTPWCPLLPPRSPQDLALTCIPWGITAQSPPIWAHMVAPSLQAGCLDIHPSPGSSRSLCPCTCYANPTPPSPTPHFTCPPGAHSFPSCYSPKHGSSCSLLPIPTPPCSSWPIAPVSLEHKTVNTVCQVLF
jgi:hypothetical protein